MIVNDVEDFSKCIDTVLNIDDQRAVFGTINSGQRRKVRIVAHDKDANAITRRTRVIRQQRERQSRSGQGIDGGSDWLNRYRAFIINVNGTPLSGNHTPHKA